MIGNSNNRAIYLNKFLEKKVEEIKKVDIDIFDEDFKIDSYRDSLLNVTKLWLLSGKYDRVRQPNWAGFFDDRLRSYQMNSEGIQKVQEDLLNEIDEKIPDIVITEVIAEPHLEDRGWSVSVTAIDSQTKITTNARDDKKATISFKLDDENFIVS